MPYHKSRASPVARNPTTRSHARTQQANESSESYSADDGSTSGMRTHTSDSATTGSSSDSSPTDTAFLGRARSRNRPRDASSSSSDGDSDYSSTSSDEFDLDEHERAENHKRRRLLIALGSAVAVAIIVVVVVLCNSGSGTGNGSPDSAGPEVRDLMDPSKAKQRCDEFYKKLRKAFQHSYRQFDNGDDSWFKEESNILVDSKRADATGPGSDSKSKLKFELSEFRALLEASSQSLRKQGRVQAIPKRKDGEVGPGGEVTIVGDLHGNLNDLLRILEATMFFENDSAAIVFNGDYVDRGNCSPEVVALVAFLQLGYPQRVFLNRGNHESVDTYVRYGIQWTQHFPPTLKQVGSTLKQVGFKSTGKKQHETRYDDAEWLRVVRGPLKDWCEALPLATVVWDKIFVVHGGIPKVGAFVKPDGSGPIPLNPQYFSLALEGGPLAAALPPMEETMPYEADEQDNRFGPGNWTAQMIWNDPRKTAGWGPSPRGTGFTWGPDATSTFLAQNGWSLIVRSHEPNPKATDHDYETIQHTNMVYDFRLEEGHVSSKDEASCVMVFSATGYSHRRCSNAGSVLKVEKVSQTRAKITRQKFEMDTDHSDMHKWAESLKTPAGKPWSKTHLSGGWSRELLLV